MKNMYAKQKYTHNTYTCLAPTTLHNTMMQDDDNATAQLHILSCLFHQIS